MRTNFSSAQLADPEIAEARGILDTCVHLGFCTNTCPTYVLTRNENDSPRGRIDLIRAMLEQGGAPDAKTVHHLDRCLSCLSCMTTCAVKVDYVHLIDRARVHIERHYRRPWADRLLRAFLATVLPRPRLFLMALRAGAAITAMRAILPAGMRSLVDMIPKNSRVRPNLLAPAIFKAEGTVRRRVALLAGCAQQVLDGNINAATIRVLQRHGCEVVIVKGAGCCGSLTLHMGREADARACARANVQAWWRELEADGLDAIVINASGCGTTVKDYGHLFAHDPILREPAQRIAALARDVSEFLHEIGFEPRTPPGRYRTAYHDPCSIQHGQRLTREPRDLLANAGFEVVDVPEKHFCCGSAGTYNLLQPEMAHALGQRKAGHITSTRPEIVATGNIGCIMQLERYLSVPIVHMVELLDWASGGSRPPALSGLPRRESLPLAAEPSPAGDADIAVW
jgi:glycolate oxidase iron-sulfur subunit